MDFFVSFTPLLSFANRTSLSKVKCTLRAFDNENRLSVGKLGENDDETQSPKEHAMSHSISSHTHSTKPAKASNVSSLHLSGSTTMKMAPLSVVVHHSESPRLKPGEEFEFDIFEAIAFKVALDALQSGHYQVDISVKFEKGHQHRCKLSLGCRDQETGFADHCFRILEHAQSLKASQPQHWYFSDTQGRGLLTLLKRYQINRQQVAQSRQSVFERVRLQESADPKRFSIDACLVGLFEKLAELNPPVGQMVTALNVVLKENDERILGKEDFESFIEQVEDWKNGQ